MCWVIMRNKLGAIDSDTRLSNGMDVDGEEGSRNWWPSALDPIVQEAEDLLDKGIKEVMGAYVIGFVKN